MASCDARLHAPRGDRRGERDAERRGEPGQHRRSTSGGSPPHDQPGFGAALDHRSGDHRRHDASRVRRRAGHRDGRQRAPRGTTASSSMSPGPARHSRPRDQRFARDGIRISGNRSVIEANYIGVGLDGTTDRGNGLEGVNIKLGRDDARQREDRNVRGVRSGKRHLGEWAPRNHASPDGNHVNGTVIAGNFIGTDAAGIGAVGNTTFGVFLGTSATTRSSVGALTRCGT